MRQSNLYLLLVLLTCSCSHNKSTTPPQGLEQKDTVASPFTTPILKYDNDNENDSINHIDYVIDPIRVFVEIQESKDLNDSVITHPDISNFKAHTINVQFIDTATGAVVKNMEISRHRFKKYYTSSAQLDMFDIAYCKAEICTPDTLILSVTLGKFDTDEADFFKYYLIGDKDSVAIDDSYDNL